MILWQRFITCQKRQNRLFYSHINLRILLKLTIYMYMMDRDWNVENMKHFWKKMVYMPACGIHSVKWKIYKTCIEMRISMNNEIKRRSGLTVMLRLIGLVKPLTGYMIIAIFMGLAGHLCASFITIFGGYAILDASGYDTGLSLKVIFISVIVFALVRAGFRYAERSCNHFYSIQIVSYYKR